LDVEGAQAHVTPARGGLAVDVTARDARAAREILARARALGPRARAASAP
jgi:hypothetical protein